MPAASQRAISALLVLLLHALLLFAFLQFLVKPQSAGIPNPERLLELMISMPKAAPPPPPAAPRAQRAPVRARPGGERSGAMPSLAPPVLTPDIRGLGQALFGCAPENLANLTPEQRAHCPGGFSRPDDSAVLEPPSHVKDPLRRAAEMKARNAPLRVPCTSVVDAPVGGGAAAVPMADPFCLMGGAIKGFGPLSGLSK
ncbi:MAG TPA: hypothetical protein VIG39_04570 [Rhizomicrobium sp.]